MAQFLENVGMEVFTESEETYSQLVGHVLQNGKLITGYYGFPYVNYHFGDVQFIARTEFNEETEHLECVGMDMHGAGNCVWDVCVKGMAVDRSGAGKTEKRIAVARASDGSGLAIVNVKNADVIPSYRKNDVLRLQMIGYPVSFDYFENGEAYDNSISEDELGRKWLIDDGTVFPSGFMANHDVNNENCEKDEWMDDYTLIRGTVQHLYSGILEVNGEKHNAFIRCIINTQFGDLEIIHAYEQVKEDQRENLVVGATFVGNCILSGDAAIYEYDQGIIRDEENSLKLFRDIVLGGDAERLKTLLTDASTYYTDTSGKTFIGQDAIIEKIQTVQNGGITYYAHLATITEVDPGEEKLTYEAGKRCLILAENEENNYVSIAFFDMTDDGNIGKITVSQERRYHFAVDQPPQYDDLFADCDIPDNFIKPMLVRASLYGFAEKTEEEELRKLGDDVQTEKNNIRLLLKAWPAEVPQRDPNLLSKAFGYLFAKAMEAEYNHKAHVSELKAGMIVSYSPADAWSGNYSTDLPETMAERLKTAMKYGSNFYKDFEAFHPEGAEEDETFDEDLETALILMQRIGRYAAMGYLSGQKEEKTEADK